MAEMSGVERLKVKMGMLFGAPGGAPRVRYGAIPFCSGGPQKKLALLRAFFPEEKHRFNILYLLSAGAPDFDLVARAKGKGVKVVVNQNGVYYPAVRPEDWESANEPIKRMLGLADYVLYQSKFAKKIAAKVVGEPFCPSAILYNAVDTRRFTPETRTEGEGYVRLISTGFVHTHSRLHRMERLFEALAILASMRSDWHFQFTGVFEPDYVHTAGDVIARLGLEEHVEFADPYDSADAPEVYGRGDVYLHYAPMDCCPNSVLEAMASGVPVVYAALGGTPELVGKKAGIGVPAATSLKEATFCDPQQYAKAVSILMDRHAQAGKAARQRAVERFDLRKWVDCHRTLFQNLLTGDT